MDKITKVLKSADKEYDLRVTFKKDLKFSKHIAMKINKANSILSLPNISFKFIDKYALIKLYTTLVLPHVEQMLSGIHTCEKTLKY